MAPLLGQRDRFRHAFVFSTTRVTTTVFPRSAGRETRPASGSHRRAERNIERHLLGIVARFALNLEHAGAAADLHVHVTVCQVGARDFDLLMK